MADDKKLPKESISGEMITAPIDDYLLSIADSLQRVQLQLNQNKVLSVDGQSYTTYQLPKLDFELRMSIEMDTSVTDGRSVMKAAPVNPSKTSRSSTKSQSVESASIIKGTFVAVPSDLGKPPPKIHTFVKKFSPTQYKVMVVVQSTVGEYLKDIQVHFNIDTEMSKKLLGSKGSGSKTRMINNATFQDAVVGTDENGMAFSLLKVSNSKNMPSVAVLIDVVGKTETIVI